MMSLGNMISIRIGNLLPLLLDLSLIRSPIFEHIPTLELLSDTFSKLQIPQITNNASISSQEIKLSWFLIIIMLNISHLSLSQLKWSLGISIKLSIQLLAFNITF